MENDAVVAVEVAPQEESVPADPIVMQEDGQYVIATPTGTRVSVQSWAEKSTAVYALEHGLWTQA